MGFYESLAVSTKINAGTTYTAIGGSIMHPEVVAAMNEAAKSFVSMHELQLKAGERIAKITKNEAAYITSGGAAGIVLAILALRTGGDLGAIGRVIEN
ncbi:MAG TPA: L-seryl-tRNA selenium transferase, partial [archaeon]|nr:L-seryl-tRNA selenium transferase [archaeon]